LEAFDSRVQYLLKLAWNAEQSNRLFLTKIINDLVWMRIDTEKHREEGVALTSLIEGLFTKKEVQGRDLIIENDSQYLERMTTVYYRIVKSIDQSSTQALLQLITSLKDPKVLLSDIFGSLASSEPVVRTRYWGNRREYHEIPKRFEYREITKHDQENK